jgi:hypothetical protein
MLPASIRSGLRTAASTLFELICLSTFVSMIVVWAAIGARV